jgi:hypothetical protein
VIAEEHDIFGDGVAVAARLEGLAEPGGICVSRMVRDNVRDKLDYAFEDLGGQQVKNIARGVRVYAPQPEPGATKASGWSTTSISLPVSGRPVDSFGPGAMTYQLRRLRLQGVIQRLPNALRYHVTNTGFRPALFFTRAYGRLIRPGLALPAQRSTNLHWPHET